jgi:hypothetical protein
MSIEINNVPNIEERAAQLGLREPKDVSILPRYFFDAASKADLLYEDSTPDVIKLLKKAGISVSTLQPPDERPTYIAEKDFTWIGPTLLFGYAYLSENPHVISVFLNVLSNFLTDHFKGFTGKANVRFSIVYKRTKTTEYREVNYDGDVEGIKGLEQVLEREKKHES